MCINHIDEYIFIHVPRTGGESISSILKPYSQDYSKHCPRFIIEEDYFSFGFIRNPWDRMYSCYRRQKDFDKCIGRSFKYYLLEATRDEVVGKSAMYHLNGCDFIGQFENLQHDFDKVMERLNKEPIELPHLNQYGEREYKQHYDNEMIDFIYKYHKPDIDYFKYQYE